MLKLTAIFRGTYQDGMEHYSDYAVTKDIPLTDQQQYMLKPPKRMTLSELILEEK